MTHERLEAPMNDKLVFAADQLLPPEKNSEHCLPQRPLVTRKDLATPFFVVLGIVAIGGLTGCGKEETAAVAPPEVLVTEAAARDVPVYREWIGTLDGSENAEIGRVSPVTSSNAITRRAASSRKAMCFSRLIRGLSRPRWQRPRANWQQAKATQVASQAESERSKGLFEKRAISEKEYINKTQLNEASLSKIGGACKRMWRRRSSIWTSARSCRRSRASRASPRPRSAIWWAPANNTVLTSVSTLDPLKILFPISESDYLAANQRVQETMSKPIEQRPESSNWSSRTVQTFPQKAELLSVDRQVQASTGTILVTALLPNPGSVLRPGFFARARIVAKVLKDAVVVPQRAVSEVQGSYQLGIIGADGKAEIRPVKVGARVGTDWVITSGLKPGEKVVVEGLQKIKAGAPVAAKPWTPPAEKHQVAAKPTTSRHEVTRHGQVFH